MTTPSPGRPDQQPPIRTQSDLEALWRRLMGRLGFSRTTLWLVLLDADGRPTPVVIPIDDIPSRPTDAVEHLSDLLAHLVQPGGSVVFLLSRPGPDGPLTPSERAWTRALEIVGRNVGSTVWPVHRANNAALRACTPDELAA
jgi:hypothetical protein